MEPSEAGATPSPPSTSCPLFVNFAEFQYACLREALRVSYFEGEVCMVDRFGAAWGDRYSACWRRGAGCLGDPSTPPPAAGDLGGGDLGAPEPLTSLRPSIGDNDDPCADVLADAATACVDEMRRTFFDVRAACEAGTREGAVTTVACDGPCLTLVGSYLGLGYTGPYGCGVPAGPEGAGCAPPGGCGPDGSCPADGSCPPRACPALWAEWPLGVVGDDDVTFGDLYGVLTAPDASPFCLAIGGVLDKLSTPQDTVEFVCGEAPLTDLPTVAFGSAPASAVGALPAAAAAAAVLALALWR